MKHLFTLTILFLILFTIGCSSVGQIGNIGGHDIYTVKTRDLISPSTTTVLVHKVESDQLHKVDGGTGPSFLGQMAGPAATAAAGYFIGEGLEDSGDRNRSTTNNDNRAQANGGKGGAGGEGGAAASGSHASQNQSQYMRQQQQQGQASFNLNRNRSFNSNTTPVNVNNTAGAAAGAISGSSAVANPTQSTSLSGSVF